MLTYYDRYFGRNRVKRRYVYAAWAFAAGTLFGMALIGVF